MTTPGESSVTATADSQPAVAEHGQRLLVIYAALMLAMLLAALAITGAGTLTAAKVFDAQRQWLQNQLGGWSADQHAELDEVLAKFSRAVLGDNSDRHLVDR